MKQYCSERKETVLRKLAPPASLTIPEVAEAEGISTATLYNWRKQASERGQVLPSRGSTPEGWSSEDKFRVVLETASMTDGVCEQRCRLSKRVQHGRIWEKCIEMRVNGCLEYLRK